MTDVSILEPIMYKIIISKISFLKINKLTVDIPKSLSKYIDAKRSFQEYSIYYNKFEIQIKFSFLFTCRLYHKHE